MGTNISGKINASNNGLDGIHIGAGASFQSSADITTNNNGRHGIFVASHEMANLKQNTVEIEELLGLPSLNAIRAEVLPLLLAIKQELENPQPSKSALRNRYDKLNEFLKGVNQSLVAGGLFNALEHLAHLGQTWLS